MSAICDAHKKKVDVELLYNWVHWKFNQLETRCGRESQYPAEGALRPPIESLEIRWVGDQTSWREDAGMRTCPREARPPGPRLSNPGERERNAVIANRVGISMLQFCSVSNSLSHTTLSIKWEVYFSKRLCRSSLLCVVMILHAYVDVYVLCVCIVGHGYTTHVWFSRRWLVHHFCLFCADGWAKIVTGHWELVKTVLHVGFGSSIQCTVVGEQKLVDDISHLGLCLKPSGVEERAISAVSMVDSIIEPLNASNSIAENMIPKRVVARTHLCLTPFVTGKATELSLLSCTLACIPSWSCVMMEMNFSGQPYFAIILQRPSLLTMSNALVRLT